MKRLWIGLLVLAVLLISGWIAAFYMEQFHRPVSTELAQAAQAAMENRLKDGTIHAANAYANWLRCRDFTAAFADHAVIEEIDALFAEIRMYADAQDSTAFAAVCAHLSELAKAVSESHRPVWQNLL